MKLHHIREPPNAYSDLCLSSSDPKTFCLSINCLFKTLTFSVTGS